jgi:hypothetical protein
MRRNAVRDLGRRIDAKATLRQGGVSKFETEKGLTVDNDVPEVRGATALMAVAGMVRSVRMTWQGGTRRLTGCGGRPSMPRKRPVNPAPDLPVAQQKEAETHAGSCRPTQAVRRAVDGRQRTLRVLSGYVAIRRASAYMRSIALGFQHARILQRLRNGLLFADIEQHGRP